MDRIDYALADSFKHKYDKVSSTQAVVHAVVFGDLQESKQAVASALDIVNDQSRQHEGFENVESAFVIGRYFLKVSGSSHAIVQFHCTFMTSTDDLTFSTERLEIVIRNNHHEVTGQVLTINPAQIVLQSVRSMMQVSIGRSVSHSVEWLPIVMLFKLFRVVDPDQLAPPLSPLSHFELYIDLTTTGIKREELDRMKEYLTKQSDYNTTRISNISDASKKILELYFTHLPRTQNLPERPHFSSFGIPTASSPNLYRGSLGSASRGSAPSPAGRQFQVVTRSKPIGAQPPLSSIPLKFQQNHNESEGNNATHHSSRHLPIRPQTGNFGSASLSRNSPPQVLSSIQQEEKRIHFPNGQDLVTAAIQFSDAIKAQDRNSKVLFSGHGHLPSLLWAKAVETSLESQNQQQAISFIREALQERMTFRYEHHGKPLSEGIIHASVLSNSPNTREMVERLLVKLEVEERDGSLTRKLFFPLRISDDSETRVQIIVTYRPMERLVIPTTNLQITVVDHSSRSPTAKIHNILTINPAQIVLLSLRSMMITTIGSNISLTPACHLLILFSRILQKVEPASLQGNLSALTPDKFKIDLIRSGTNDDELEDMKTYLKECSIYGEKHRISLLATATGFFHDYYFSNLPSFRENLKKREEGLAIRKAPSGGSRWTPY
ncbi:hypothetical protein JCM5350_006790 [Sporobolomyces pararoseus]